jgi:hypothetical protein
MSMIPSETADYILLLRGGLQRRTISSVALWKVMLTALAHFRVDRSSVSGRPRLETRILRGKFRPLAVRLENEALPH